MNDGFLDYWPDDLTARLAADARLDQVQARLAADRLFLPVDPPGPQNWSIGELVNAAPTGPLRFSYGPLRDQIIGCTYELADGLPRKSGGRVAKNVAGLDLHRLMVGAGGQLARVTDVCVRLRPQWGGLAVLITPMKNAEELEAGVARVLSGALRPLFVELTAGTDTCLSLHVGFAGVQSAISWQTGQARQMFPQGDLYTGEAAGREYASLRDRLAGGVPLVTSVLSNQVPVITERWLALSRERRFSIEIQARAADGVLLVRPTPPTRTAEPPPMPADLKQAFSDAAVQIAGETAALRPAYGGLPDHAWLNRVKAAMAEVAAG